MSSKDRMVCLSLCSVFLGLVAAVPAFAGSAPIGSVAGSMNATMDGQALLPNTTLFSGDSLQVKEGVAVVALGSASRVVFGHDTVASLLGDSNAVTVLLSQGNVSVFQDVTGMPVRMKIGDLSVAPVSGFKTLGEVAMLNGAVVVTTSEGTLRVEGNGKTVNVAKGKTITVVPKTNAPPSPGGGGGGGKNTLEWAILDTGLAAAGLIIGGVGISRADSSSSKADAAASEAAAAASDAAAGISAANAAASAAAAAASFAAAEENIVGCDLNQFAYPTSPYVPPSGYYCPPHP